MANQLKAIFTKHRFIRRAQQKDIQAKKLLNEIYGNVDFVNNITTTTQQTSDPNSRCNVRHELNISNQKRKYNKNKLQDKHQDNKNHNTGNVTPTPHQNESKRPKLNELNIDTMNQTQETENTGPNTNNTEQSLEHTNQRQNQQEHTKNQKETQNQTINTETNQPVVTQTTTRTTNDNTPTSNSLKQKDSNQEIHKTQIRERNRKTGTHQLKPSHTTNPPHNQNINYTPS
ncbi:hypothetical protein CHS0354_007077 [Potamilus streckersoni]|uniref:Uncharacterized protein n=1 Tax=Potamilus streckersoni TaxID=2493646 RepID=A0AAE0RYI9_9BIVA|nr:hypothetical protein CHS0354_007077 [Potamilus streckersoni]